jgi:hypothetical protein
MSRIDLLIQNYRRHVSLPLRPNAASAQRVWFAVYPPDDERRIQHSMEEFALATREANLGWHLIDLHGRFASWIGSVEEKERKAWFEHPQDVELYARSEWREKLASLIKTEAASVPDSNRCVIAITGLTELFDYFPVSDLLESIDQAVPGYLLLFFPGERENNTYRFLCARDGWTYLAVPIASDR